MSDQERMVCIAMDAFRLCIGMKPRNFAREDVIRHLRYCFDCNQPWGLCRCKAPQSSEG
jgi:hypothetical protein